MLKRMDQRMRKRVGSSSFLDGQRNQHVPPAERIHRIEVHAIRVLVVRNRDDHSLLWLAESIHSMIQKRVPRRREGRRTHLKNREMDQCLVWVRDRMMDGRARAMGMMR